MHLSFFHAPDMRGFRRLSAIEIAEGALMANVAVIFQIASLYLPPVGGFFRMFVPVLFAVLVLRRGLYVGIISLCVTVCLLAMLLGIHSLSLMLMECGAGLFLGFTMRHRWYHLPLLLLGVTGSAFLLYGSVFVLTWLSGLPIGDVITALQKSYTQTVTSLGTLAPGLGLGGWWKTTGEPLAATGAQQFLHYWWIWLYVGLWCILWPLVVVVYYITNSCVRLLGYDVRHFPGGRLEQRLNRVVGGFIAQGLKQRRARRSEEEE